MEKFLITQQEFDRGSAEGRRRGFHPFGGSKSAEGDVAEADLRGLHDFSYLNIFLAGNERSQSLSLALSSAPGM